MLLLSLSLAAAREECSLWRGLRRMGLRRLGRASWAPRRGICSNPVVGEKCGQLCSELYRGEIWNMLC
jgi:hypothetical protein